MKLTREALLLVAAVLFVIAAAAAHRAWSGWPVLVAIGLTLWVVEQLITIIG